MITRVTGPIVFADEDNGGAEDNGKANDRAGVGG
jgi:hypothetical protein